MKVWRELELTPRGSDALVELARSLADALDLAQIRKDPYAAAAVARELRSTLESIRPIATADDDGLGELLATVRAPLGNAADA